MRADFRVVDGEKLAKKKSEEGGWKKRVIRMVRKRWRGVAPYFYTVWPLFCIIPHLARSSRDAGSRYADLLHVENPNLPSVSPFRRMMNDAGRDPPGPSWFSSFREGGCVRFSRNDGRVVRRSICDTPPLAARWMRLIDAQADELILALDATYLFAASPSIKSSFNA